MHHMSQLIAEQILQEEIGGMKGHFGPINTLAFSPDGRSFSSGGEDGYVGLHHFDPDYNIKMCIALIQEFQKFLPRRLGLLATGANLCCSTSNKQATNANCLRKILNCSSPYTKDFPRLKILLTEHR